MQIPQEMQNNHNILSKIMKIKDQIDSLSIRTLTCTSDIMNLTEKMCKLTLNSLDSLKQLCTKLYIKYLENPSAEYSDIFDMLDLDYSDKISDFSEILSKIKEFYRSEFGCSTRIRWFSDNNLKEFDFLINKIEDVPKTIEGISLGGHIIEIGYDKELYYGGIKENKAIGMLSVYSKKTSTFKFLKAGRPRAYGSSAYYKEKIYFFGGWCVNNLQDCQIYSMNNSWSDGSQLPEASNYCSSASYMECGIWITGFNMHKVYLYSPENLSFTPYLDLPNDTFKYCFVVSNELYIINNNSAFTLKSNEWKENITTGNLNGPIISSFKIRNNTGYFTELTNKATLKRYKFKKHIIENIYLK